MKFFLIALLFTLQIISSSLSSLKEYVFRPAMDLITTDESVQYDKVWSLCDDPNSHLIQADSVVLEPEVPTVGQDLKVSLKGYLKDTVKSGTVKLQLKLGFIKLNKEFDLCSALSDVSDSSCPLQQGQTSITVKSHIPKEIPALPVKGQVHVYDQSSRLVTCVDLSFRLKR